MCSKNKGADQLYSYCTADLRLCFLHMQKALFPHDVVHVLCGQIQFRNERDVHFLLTVLVDRLD